MIACEVVVSAPPLEMFSELSGVLSGSPGAAGQLRNTFSDGEIGTLDVGGVDVAA